ncbi:hypothetical protein HMN09_00146500 [Mycena chlorophos]|uniref:Uncharacterized protein n=1 Tax=Mycena chlorophos TaxID=658473 RepID=A0A8H6WQA4_MYCCL|nr:hypothetical protein HMN09_00146500 [Mycena chlorophos]
MSKDLLYSTRGFVPNEQAATPRAPSVASTLSTDSRSWPPPSSVYSTPELVHSQPIAGVSPPVTPDTARPFYHAPPTAIPLPPTDPAEELYKHYRDQLANVTDIAQPITELLEAGVTPSQEKVVAALLARLAPHTINPQRRAAYLSAVRLQAIQLFRGNFDDGAWQAEATAQPHPRYLTSRSVNISALLGSLFQVGLFPIEDLFICIERLVSAPPAFLKLMAVHALVVHAGPESCAGDVRERVIALFNPVFDRDRETGAFVWGPTEQSDLLVRDLMEMLKGYFTSDNMSAIREQAHA